MVERSEIDTLCGRFRNGLISADELSSNLRTLIQRIAHPATLHRLVDALMAAEKMARTKRGDTADLHRKPAWLLV
jgi:hypothetical protein